MASQYPIQTNQLIDEPIPLLAQAFNTLNIDCFKNCILETTQFDGDREPKPSLGTSEIVNKLEKIINNIGASHMPAIAEIAKLKTSPRKTRHGVAIEVDDAPFLFISLELDKNKKLKKIYIHSEAPEIYDVDFSGDRPGFNAARYKSTKDFIWLYRKESVKNLNTSARPHFVAVILENQDPARILFILDELTRNFDGSTCELLIKHEYSIGNIDSQNKRLEFKTEAEKAICEMGASGFPSLGVLLGDVCIRPGYRSWHPDDVISDLLRMGLSKSTQSTAQEINPNQ